MVVSVQNELKNRKKPDINLAVKKITNFINVSNKLANGKSSLLIGIYDTINLVETSIINEDDYGKFEEVSKKIVKLDPTLFKGRLLLGE